MISCHVVGEGIVVVMILFDDVGECVVVIFCDVVGDGVVVMILFDVVGDGVVVGKMIFFDVVVDCVGML